MNVYEELNEASRRYLLKEMLDGPRNVSELVEATNLKQPNVSNHLARLKARGLVRASKVGRQVYYALATADVEDAIRNILNIAPESPENVDLHSYAKDYAKAATRGNEITCQEIVERALRAQHTLIDIYEELLAPAMAAVGTWYKVEAIDEAQEHMASEITARMMARVSQFFGPKPMNGNKVLLGCAPNNYHVIGLRMVSDYLKFCGWDVIYLGSNTPMDSFVKAVTDCSPDLVCLSCSSDDGIISTLELLRELNTARGNPPAFVLGVGGGAVQDNLGLFQDAGADFTTNNLKIFAEQSLPEIERVSRSGKNWRTANLDGFRRRWDKGNSN